MDLRVNVHLDSENLCLPELKPLIGKDVEITVRERSKRRAGRTRKRARKIVSKKSQHDFEAIAKAQGVKPIRDPRELLGGWPKSELNDGFEEELRKWRKSDIVPELEGDL
ncbi:MAG TPA: hypothetical protein VKX17_08205 [Planctomycetota bacterium]|nr:hypothetical protein [Planctomycetota bacterium]